MFNKFKTVGLALAVVAAPLAASASTIVVNGSFEDLGSTPTFTAPNYTIYGNGLPGWTTTSGGIEVQTAATLGLTPDDGNNYIELDGDRNYTISQSLMLAAGDYVMSFAYSPRNGNVNSNGVSYALGSLFSGSVAGPSAVPFTAVGVWSTISTAFTVATAGNYVLSFAGTGTSNRLGGFIDDIRVDAASISAVPVPAAGLLLLSALGGIAAVRRRRQV